MPKFYFTFGGGQTHAGHYHVVEAEDEDEARLTMIRRFGTEWAMQYDEEQWHTDDGDQAELYGYAELTFRGSLLDIMLSKDG
jgi:hypothetical protein